MQQGLVIRNTGSSYIVLLDNNTHIECHVKGNFRVRGIRSTNPVAVGDRVCVQEMPDGTAWITDLQDRKNYIIRRATNLSKQSHIIAANIDMAALVITVNHPVTSLTFIDRFLATAQAYNVPACLIINKEDLYSDTEKQQVEHIKQLYLSIGYPVYIISAIKPEAQQTLEGLFRNKIVLLSGNSGVGKSTLLNSILGEEVTRTGEISTAHNKGMHTTTFSQMYPYAGGWLIDTPGIKGFGTLDMKKAEISHYFPEIFCMSQHCRYSDCTHTDEPDCAVISALEEGKIALSRYESYLSIINDYDENKYR